MKGFGEKRQMRTGSPFIGVFEREGQAVVDGCDLDAGLRTALGPLCILK